MWTVRPKVELLPKHMKLLSKVYSQNALVPSSLMQNLLINTHLNPFSKAFPEICHLFWFGNCLPTEGVIALHYLFWFNSLINSYIQYTGVAIKLDFNNLAYIQSLITHISPKYTEMSSFSFASSHSKSRQKNTFNYYLLKTCIGSYNGIQGFH